MTYRFHNQSDLLDRARLAVALATVFINVLAVAVHGEMRSCPGWLAGWQFSLATRAHISSPTDRRV